MSIGHIRDKNGTQSNLPNKSVFGIKRSMSSSSPEWERTDGAIGFTATASVGTTAGSSSFDTCYPWCDMKRVTLSTDDVMVYIPKFWYQRYVEYGVEYIKISGKERSGYLEHPGSGKYIGAYSISSSNKSVSGVYPTVNLTRATFRSNASSKGTGWSLADIATWSAVVMLYLVEFASNNSQAKIGMGRSNMTSDSTGIWLGSCDGVPNLTGRPAGTDGQIGVVYRGVENPWGNYWEWVDGLNIHNLSYYFCIDSSKFADNTTDNYTQLNYSGSTTGYITTMGCDEKYPWAMLPNGTGGSGQTYYCDYANFEQGWRNAARNGYWTGDYQNGIFSSILHFDSSFVYNRMTSRLMYNPQI